MASDKLQALLDKMNKVGSSGGGGYWSPQEGDHMIRVLPPVGDMDFFFQEVGQHRLPDGKYVTCPSFTTDGKYDCPICDLTKELYGTNEEADREVAGKIRMKKKFFMNVIVRDPKDTKAPGTTGAGPFVFTPGITIFQAIQTLVNSPEYGDISREGADEGVDLLIHREGQGLKTEYAVQTRRAHVPLHTDPAQIDKWLDAAKDLSWVMLTDKPEEDGEYKDEIVVLMPYDRIVKEFGIGPGMSSSDVDVVDEKAAAKPKRGAESDEDPFPAKASATGASDAVLEVIQQHRQRRRSR